MSEKVTGGCLCGQIRYELSAPVQTIVQCHCTHCQKVSGAGASVNAMVAADDFKITQGEPSKYQDTAASGNKMWRAFCGNCGSSLFSQRDNMPDKRILKVGSLDDSSAAKIVMNIWTQSARPWVMTDPQIPSHEGNRPA